MKSIRFSDFSLTAIAGLGLLLVGPTVSVSLANDPMASAADTASHTEKADWLAKAKAGYPLNTCVVSGDELKEGSMGGPVDYIHKEAGKADRLVRFCCKSCVKDFKKDPAKYLKLIDDAAAAKAGHAHHM